MATKAKYPRKRPGDSTTEGPPSSPRELIFKARPGVGFRASRQFGPSAEAADVAPLAKLLEAERATIEPLFGLSEVRMRDRMASLESAGSEFLDMDTFYHVDAPEERLDNLAETLRQRADLVEAAYVKPASEEPVASEAELEVLNDMQPMQDEAPAHTPDFTASQIYLNAAPAGIDARYAWTVSGGRGAGVKIIDCEWGWRFTHEDLLQNQMGVVVGVSSSSDNHGTAVLGEISGDRNLFGITGICSDANVGAASFVSFSSATTIRKAADRLNAGDIILLEIHRPGPNATGSGQFGFIAVEWWPDDFAAIRYAVNKGIIVVEAAGNGAQNFDAAVYNTPQAGFPGSWKNPFNPANPSSGAVVVGAGAPPPGTHGRSHGPDRSRLGFSNYGKRVDCQGWGREVTSTGYGNLQGGTKDEWYTETFSGTSSASPIVVGALGCVQGILKAQGGTLLTPGTAINLLRSTGSPQTDAPGRPKTQRIGKRPNLRQLIAAASKIWQNNKTVTRTYSTHHSQNAHAFISGLGWRKIKSGSADGVTNMFAGFCEAVANSRKVDVYVDGSNVYRMVLR